MELLRNQDYSELNGVWIYATFKGMYTYIVFRFRAYLSSDLYFLAIESVLSCLTIQKRAMRC